MNKLNCIGCGVELDYRDEDPNGDTNCICVRCRTEERHDFDAEPNVKFNRYGQRVAEPQSTSMPKPRGSALSPKP